MTDPFEDESVEYMVLANADERYSLWPAWMPAPAGWVVTGAKGPRELCVAWIESHLVDFGAA